MKTHTAARGSPLRLLAALALGLLAALPLLARPVAATTACSSLPPGLIGYAQSIGGDALGIDVQGGYAYVADWSGWLQVFDVSDPCSPTRLPGAVQNPYHEIGDLDVEGSYAYMAADGNGLRIYDISEPTQPTFLAGRSDASYAHNVFFDGGSGRAYTGYIYAPNAPLAIYDTTRLPLEPPTVYLTNIRRDVFDVNVVGTLAYLLAGDGEGNLRFQVVDVSSPTAPALLGELPFHHTQYGNVGEIRVRGDYAFLSTSYASGGLLVIKISDPGNLRVAAYKPVARAGTIPWKGTGLDLYGDRAYLVEQDGIYAFDISNPEEPIQETSFPFPASFGVADGGHIVVRDGLAYVAVYRHWPPTGHDHGGLAIYNLGSDETPPTITGGPTTEPNAAGWYNGPVTVHFTCSDDGSGIAFCSPDVALESDGAGQSVTGTAVDLAGNTAETTVGGINIDSIAPVVTVGGIADGGIYTLGAVPAASCAATDGGSGVVGACELAVTGGLPNGVGTFSYRATAADAAGNTTTVTGSYRVIYRWDGFLQPINDTAHQTGAGTSVFKAGSTVPVKFQLKSADGAPVQTNGAAPTWLSPQLGGPTSATIDESVYADQATSGTSFRWDGASQQYIYNWSTRGNKAGFYYRVGVTLDDGQTYTVNIGLR